MQTRRSLPLMALRHKCIYTQRRFLSSVTSRHKCVHTQKFLSGGHSSTEPPESIPNSAVKRISGDGSVGLPHVRVAHRQAPNLKKGYRKVALFYCVVKSQNLVS